MVIGQCLEENALTNDLTEHKKPKLLFKNSNKDTERLIQLWVANGIVSSKEEGHGEWEVAEDVAEHYLMELATRCMIQVRDMDPATLKVKTFQLHDEMRKTKLKLGTLRNLLTLVNFNTKNCYLKDLSNMTNLRVLAICGPFKIQGFNEKKLDKNPPIIQAKYLHTLSISSFSERIDPRHLNHLLSSCASICKLSLVHVKISKLPELCYLSYNHAYIHLENCELQEDPMPKLEQLPNLRVLELCYDTFQGKEMFCSAQGFHSHSC
ncbi:hypothetical protein V6N11_080352 [Hibiscus sabdariffa]|uniref:Disease resistance protein winged helix domain-containing protein n=1 Tax=Hibiscus sabdariffa TaxID=183260 RepID=A0ABR2R7E4_9ROSI